MRRVNGLCSLLLMLLVLGLALPARGDDDDDDDNRRNQRRGLRLISRVRKAGSDRRSRQFLRRELPRMQQLMKHNLSQQLSTQNLSTTLLDPARMQLQNAYSARVYFVGEDAVGHNTLGLQLRQGDSSKAGLLFPKASTNGQERTRSDPILPGDFVSLGSLAAGSKLDFFMLAKGASGSGSTVSTSSSANPDGMRYAMTHAYSQPNSPFLMLAFEDLQGDSDGDYNDLMLAVDVGSANVNQMVKTVGAPEPSTILTLTTFLAVGAGLARRRKRQ